jgi:hypothetical protein
MVARVSVPVLVEGLVGFPVRAVHSLRWKMAFVRILCVQFVDTWYLDVVLTDVVHTMFSMNIYTCDFALLVVCTGLPYSTFRLTSRFRTFPTNSVPDWLFVGVFCEAG